MLYTIVAKVCLDLRMPDSFFFGKTVYRADKMLLFAVKIAYKITQTIAKHRVKVPFIAVILSSLYHMQTLLFLRFHSIF